MRKKLTPIELDKARNLRFNLTALEFIEEHTGKSFLSNFEMTSVKEIGIVLFAGLKHEDKSLTLEDVTDMVDLSNFKYVGERIQEAFKVTMPKNKPESNPESKPEGNESPLSESQSA